MPKKKPKTEEDISKRDKILEEVAAKLKLIEDGHEKESKLEEETGIDLNSLSEMEFSDFIPSSGFSENRAPVLERIAGSQPGPIFVGGMPQTVNIPGEEGKTDEFKYVPGLGGDDEPKYIGFDSRISAEITPIDLMNVGRQTDLIPQTNQEIFSMHSESNSQISSPTFERAERAERIDIESTGRRDPFEGHEAKYKNYKPKFPK